jgi:hypothetical protein
MIFKMFRMRKTVREIRSDTGGFVADEAVGLVKGLLLIPVVIVLVGLALFFVLGFTTVLGGPLGLFKVLFIIGACVSVLVFAVIYPIIRFVRRSTARVVRRGVQSVRNEFEQ